MNNKANDNKLVCLYSTTKTMLGPINVIKCLFGLNFDDNNFGKKLLKIFETFEILKTDWS